MTGERDFSAAIAASGWARTLGKVVRLNRYALEAFRSSGEEGISLRSCGEKCT